MTTFSSVGLCYFSSSHTDDPLKTSDYVKLVVPVFPFMAWSILPRFCMLLAFKNNVTSSPFFLLLCFLCQYARHLLILLLIKM